MKRILTVLMLAVFLGTVSICLVACGREKTAAEVYDEYVTKVAADIAGRYKDFDVMVTYFDADEKEVSTEVISYSETEYILFVEIDDLATTAKEIQERISFRDEVVSRKILAGEQNTTNTVLDRETFNAIVDSIYEEYFKVCIPTSAEKLVSWKNVFRFSGSVNYEIAFSSQFDEKDVILRLGINTLTDKPHILEIEDAETHKKVFGLKFNYPMIGKLVFNKVLIPDTDTMIERAKERS